MDRFQEMLADLRSTFSKKIPGGLSPPADTRLQKTLEHFVGEVERVNGSPKTIDILSLTYDSMAKWIKRQMTQVEQFESEVDPATLFASLNTQKNEEKREKEKGKENEGFLSASTDLQIISPRVAPSPYVQQKDALQPQEDVVKYRESEYNLVMNSKDRDWVNNITQNRYNFTIQFNTNYKGQGSGYTANIQSRLRNIVRIEFVKVILPVEGLDIILPKTSGVPSSTNAFYSVLAMPSINVLVDEFQGNNFGTSNSVDKSLAVCQYDALWRPDHFSAQAANRGYTLFIPKFLKAHRVYTPTPLSNLQTLSFRIQDNQDNLLSTIADAASIATIALGNTVTGSSQYIDTSGTCIFIKTNTWFPVWSFSQLDKILIQGLGFMSGSQPAGGAALVQWLQNSAGHTVVGCAYDPSGQGTQVTDGPNSVGYCNWIIIQNRFLNPQTGGTGLNYFTGASATEPALGTDLLKYPQQGAALNLSRQVQLTLRIVTREYDLTTNIRPDNV